MANKEQFDTVNDMMISMDKWWKSKPLFYRIIRTIRWRIIDPIIEFPRDVKNNIKWIYQTLRYGFSNRELWDLDITIAQFIYPRLKKFISDYKKAEVKGYPLYELAESKEDRLGNFEEEKENYYIKKWENILDLILEAFDLILKSNWKSTEDYKIQEKKIKIGLRLFAKYFRCLND